MRNLDGRCALGGIYGDVGVESLRICGGAVKMKDIYRFMQNHDDNYSLLRNNCQHFARKLVLRVGREEECKREDERIRRVAMLTGQDLRAPIGPSCSLM